MPTEEATPPAITEASLSNNPPRKTIIDRQRELFIAIEEDEHEKMYHIEDFGLYPSWPVIELAITPTGNMQDDRMNHFVKFCTSLFAKILYVDDTAAIAPIEIINDSEKSYITYKVVLPSNFTKLSKWIMISGGSWVFNKKEKRNNNVYMRFCLKSQVPAKYIINRVSFELIHLGGSKINKKPMQKMEIETPMMLLFVCNGTDQASLATDIKQILELAHKDIKTDGMMSEEYENQDILAFSTRLNILRLPARKSSQGNKAIDHMREQGKKAFHLEVAKTGTPFLNFLPIMHSR
jgi:hypothetical protein